MVSIGETRKAERAEGPATVMAIGTANPPNCVDQSTYTLITTSESPTTSTRQSSRRNSRSFGNQISGEEATIKKRYMHLTEEILKENPNV